MIWLASNIRGWRCGACGFLARNWTTRLVHERRAVRGLGCAAAPKD